MKRLCAAGASLMVFAALIVTPAAAQGVAQAAAGAGPAADLPAATAANGAAGVDFDPAQYIGLDMKAALDALGAPREVFSFRGQSETQDNVVFFYPDYLYLFWYGNKVWQVRCDRRFARPLFGMAMGMPRDVIERTSPRQFMAKGDSLFFDIDDSKYPLRVRLVFTNNALTDLYVYRSDF
jgi:hypothetical protein